MKALAKRNFKKRFNLWALLSILGVALVLLPTLNIFLNLFAASSENWSHIKEYLLKEYISNSLIIIAFTGVFTVIIGVLLAWIIAAYEFPFKRFFKWALILPMAIPPNIAAYTYSGMLSYTGAIQIFLRNNGIVVNQKWFDIMSIKGTIFIFTFFLFPYVYIITKSFLEKQSSALIENARVLGKNSVQIFFEVVLPICRPSIIGGVSLVILEVLNDFGVVSYFGINTFSTAIFTTWFGMYDLNSAIRLAFMLMSTVIIILVGEKLIRGRKIYSFTTSKITPLKPKRLKNTSKLLPFFFCFMIFSISFLIPFLQLLSWGIKNYKYVLDMRFVEMIYNTVLVSVIASTIIMMFSVIISNFSRIDNSKISKVISKLVMLGYSIPAAVIAIGVISFFIGLDKMFWGENSALILSSSLAMVTFAYIIRYLGIGYSSVEAGFDKIGLKYLEASRMLGMSVAKSFFKVDLKLIKGSIVSGFMLVFIDILKELPLTLILRPFNFDTLATKTYQFASDEKIQYASIPALIIIFISILAIFILNIGDREGDK